MLSTFHQLYTVLIDLLCLNNADNWNSASMLILYYAKYTDGPTLGLLLISMEKTGLDIITSLKL